MKWQDYEEAIFRKLALQFPEAELTTDVRLQGLISGVPRQVDILARGKLLDSRPMAVIDCKCFSRKVEIKTVEAFLGLARDVGAHVGVIVTNVGYSDAALARAERDYDREVRLYVVELSEIEKLPKFQVVYCGYQGVRLAVPFDWRLTEGEQRAPGMFGWDLIPSGTDRETAYKLHRWGCVSLIPVAHEETLEAGRAIFARYHNAAEDADRFECRAENIGVGDITYSRKRSRADRVDLAAFRVSPGLVAVVEIKTVEEHAAADEAMLVDFARSMIPMQITPLADQPLHEAWAGLASEIIDGPGKGAR